MKTFKTVMYDIGIIAATIVSMLLMVSLFLTATLSFSTAFLKTDEIEEIVENIDYAKLIEEEMEKSKDNNIQEMDDKVVKELLKTEMMEEIIELCVENIFDKLEGKESKKEFSVEEVKKIGNRYDEEIQDLLKKHYDKAAGLSDEKLEELTDNLIDTYANTIVEMAPTTESLGLTNETIASVSNVKDGTYLWISIAITAGLSLILFLILIVNFKGLIWLGIDYFISAVATFVTSFFVDDLLNVFVKGTVLSKMDISSVTGIISVNMIISSVVMLILSAAFVVLYIVLKRVKKKRAAKKTMITPVPVQEIADIIPETLPEEEPKQEVVAETADVAEATDEGI